MLNAIASTKLKLIDGQEQFYYHKTPEQFEKSRLNFYKTSEYFTGKTKENYVNLMDAAIGLYPRPITHNSGKNSRLFNESEIINSFKYAAKNQSIKYIWVYEEIESFWFLESYKSRYFSKGEIMSKISNTAFDRHIKNINTGLNYNNFKR